MKSICAPEFDRLIEEYDTSTDPNYLFLDTTLVRKYGYIARQGTGYFYCRSWRKDLKKIQVQALRNLKCRPHHGAVVGVARQIAERAVNITNGVAYDFVTAVPAGSSGKKVNFASVVAPFVASELGARYEAALSGQVAGPCSSSHPKQSLRFSAKYSGGDISSGLVLLVDDVATTGVHFEKCVAALRKHGNAVVCLSWIA